MSRKFRKLAVTFELTDEQLAAFNNDRELITGRILAAVEQAFAEEVKAYRRKRAAELREEADKLEGKVEV